MKKPRLLLPLCLSAFLSGVSSLHADTLTYEDLTRRLYDMENVAMLPLPGEKNALASSYDRASRYDEASGKYVKWDANGDGHGIIRKEGEQEVLAEMNGPGVIWRIWSATPKDGHVRIYLDGGEKPAVDLPFKAFFDQQNAPFTYPALVYKTSANGFNSYVPIPYQKSCKIVADKGWGDYFQFTYSSFPAGTVLPTFTRDLGDKEKAALNAADKALSTDLGQDPAARPDEQTERANITVPAGGKATVAEIKGPRAITSLRVKLDAAALENGAPALREAVLVIKWDDATAPAVWVPLGDFFGVAPSAGQYKSLPAGMTADGFYSFWYMPFRKAHIEILNEGGKPLPLQFTIKHAPLNKPVDALGRFHAKWHRDSMLPNAQTGRTIDWPMLVTQGRGRYVGVTLHVWNPRGGWWGEGDEKFFVDGEKFPSTIGTGSEDYFGYAWSSMKLFNQALHSQPSVDLRAGHNSVNRWHIADNVPFQSGIEADIEKYYPNSKPTIYAATAYWYLQADGSDPYGYVPLDKRMGYYTTLPPTAQVKGAIEGEEAKIISISGGKAAPQGMEGFADGEWSNLSQLWWTGARPGDKLTLNLPIAVAGKYDIKAQFTKAKDYGIFQFYLDDQKIGTPMDFYNPTVVATGTVSLGQLDLTAGDHKLTAEIVGANEKADKAYMMGLDYIRPEPVK